MSIDPKLLSNFPVIAATLGLLIGGKTILVALIGRLFGISIISGIRAGFLLAPGGEFAFVAFGEAVNQGSQWPSHHGSRFELVDVRSLFDRVATERALDLPIYFGDSGSEEVLHNVGAERACAAAITLDFPGANYRKVVPESLAPSLQLAAAVLAQAKLPALEIAETINEFRCRHLAELTEATGSSTGYGFSES
ncbi:hypothetical protein F3Y22_tig00111100pilonHSYRG00040 [Hibiscus syriacus]|uniref:Uncharacterized protein n=1 Tax=Hibiscus syriacus TaxID=106335 RepID=A0A6A2Z0E7_HIBSY|nr:hypothetical protein F3Y22_tig00111100pilonHSYRG00040 [Hibiscus syriacus]